MPKAKKAPRARSATVTGDTTIMAGVLTAPSAGAVPGTATEENVSWACDGTVTAANLRPAVPPLPPAAAAVSGDGNGTLMGAGLKPENAAQPPSPAACGIEGEGSLMAAGLRPDTAAQQGAAPPPLDGDGTVVLPNAPAATSSESQIPGERSIQTSQSTGTPVELEQNHLPDGFNLQHGYTILKCMGSGSFGNTYLARDSNGIHRVVKESFPRFCAYREGAAVRPRPGMELDFDESQRIFDVEVEILKKLHGIDNKIPDLSMYFEENGTKYYLMNYYKGGTLDKIAEKRRQTPFAEEELTGILSQMLELLSSLHENELGGILHRDIKPSNIASTTSDDYSMIDFGTACYRDRDSLSIARFAGTPNYSAPEQFCADFREHLCPASDIYALGATIYFLVTGESYNKEAMQALGEYATAKLGSAAKYIELPFHEVLGVMAEHLEANQKKIDAFANFSLAFRNALKKALNPEIKRRFAKAGNWSEMLERDKIAEVELENKANVFKHMIFAKPESVKKPDLDKLERLAAKYPRAYWYIGHYYKWKATVPKASPQATPQKWFDLGRRTLELAVSHGVEEAAADLADCLNIADSYSAGDLAKMTDLYTMADMPEAAASCAQTRQIVQEYERRAASWLSVLGVHNLYLASQLAGRRCTLHLPPACAFLRLRGVCQMLATILTAGIGALLVRLLVSHEAAGLAQAIHPPTIEKTAN